MIRNKFKLNCSKSYVFLTIFLFLVLSCYIIFLVNPHILIKSSFGDYSTELSNSFLSYSINYSENESMIIIEKISNKKPTFYDINNRQKAGDSNSFVFPSESDIENLKNLDGISNLNSINFMRPATITISQNGGISNLNSINSGDTSFLDIIKKEYATENNLSSRSPFLVPRGTTAFNEQATFL